MKKTALSAIAISALIVSVMAGIQNVHGFLPVFPISITYPSNTTYNSGFLNLTVTTKIWLSRNSASMTYSLDEKESTVMPLEATFVPLNGTRTYPNGTTTTVTSMFSYYIITGYVALPKLSDGTHKITVYATYTAGTQVGNDDKTVYFTINDGVPPVISDLYTNCSYHEGGICLLAFTVNEPTSWMGYSLDNQANVTITSNTTLSGLTVGSHSLTVYANDTAGNMGKANFVFFEGDILPSSTPSPAPTLSPSPSIPEFPLWTILPLFVAASAFLIVFKKKAKRK